MGRPPVPKDQRRIKRTIRVDPVLLDWIQDQVLSRRFKDETHAFEYAVAKLMADEKARSPERGSASRSNRTM